MKRWRITRWQPLAVFCVVVLAGFAVIVWRAQKLGGACHDSDNSYLCKLISPTNIPTDYVVIIGSLGVFAAVFTLKSIHHQAVQMRKQTKMVISKEHARVEVKPIPINFNKPTQPHTYVVQYEVSFYCPTAAFIREAKAWLDTPTSQEATSKNTPLLPIREIPSMVMKSTVIKCRSQLYMPPTYMDEMEKQERTIRLWGFIKYVDVFDKERQVDFCYNWNRVAAVLLEGKPLSYLQFWKECSRPRF